MTSNSGLVASTKANERPARCPRNLSGPRVPGQFKMFQNRAEQLRVPFRIKASLKRLEFTNAHPVDERMIFRHVPDASAGRGVKPQYRSMVLPKNRASGHDGFVINHL